MASVTRNVGQLQALDATLERMARSIEATREEIARALSKSARRRAPIVPMPDTSDAVEVDEATQQRARELLRGRDR